MAITWCYGFVLTLGYYGTQEQDWGAYTQEVVKFSMKRCCIVGNTTYGSRGGVANFFNIPMGRNEQIQQLVTWLFIEPLTLQYPNTRFLERCFKK